ncbi:MAG: S8 family serine peptidase [Firmicutes bacterium]|nr:S8 family serine peptidase [Candidatus Fiminaster equi]
MHKNRSIFFLSLTSLALGFSTITFGLVKNTKTEGVVVRELTEEEIAHPVYAVPFEGQEPYDSFGKDNTKYKNGNQDCSMTILGQNTKMEDVWNAYRGDDTVIAVIDTGIDYNHPDFKFADGSSKILNTSRYYFVSGNQIQYYQYGINTNDYNYLDHDWDSTNGKLNAHGTNVASSAASAINGNGGTVGIAPNAKILALKTDMNLSSINEAIKYATSCGVDVINMSLGAYAESFRDSYGTYHEGYASTASYLSSSINSAYNNGIIVVAAAGNENTTISSYPACNSHVIGVGAFASGSYSKASFSNYNPSTSTSSTINVNVDLSAPGYVYAANETATYKSGTISNRTNSFTNTQGTSFASPIVAGAACLWKQKNPNGTAAQFETALYNACDDKGATGWDTTFGHGALNLSKLLFDNSSPTSVLVKAKNDQTTITSGDNVQLYAQVQPLSVSNREVEWSSSIPSVATVNSTTGVITGGNTAGTTIITATSKASSSVKGQITITNNSGIDVTSVSFFNKNVTVDEESSGDTADTFAYEVLPSNATHPEVTFTSSNEDILSLDNSIWLSGQAGTAIITIKSVSNPSLTDTCTVTVGSGGGGGEQTEYVYKSCTFAKGNTSTSTAAYTNVSAVYTSNGFSIKTTNFNNNNKAWDYIKCGGKTGAYTGTLQTNAAIDKEISKINISVDSINSAGLTRVNLYISSSASTSGVTPITINLTTPTTSVEIPTSLMGTNKFYTIEFVCSKVSDNGVVQLSGISFLTGGTGGDTPAVTLSSISVSSNHRTFNVNDTFVKETVTARYSDNSSKVVSNATFSTPDMTTVGTKTIDVSYTESSITVNTSYQITVKESGGTSGGDDDIDEYYSTISDSLTETSLLSALRSLNLRMRTSTVGYSGMGTSTSGKFKYTDYDPTSVQYDSNGQPYGTRILSFYSGTPCTSWNREHVWPNSRGGGSKGSAGEPYPDADIYMPRPTISSENSDRGNSKYVEGLSSSSSGWDPIKAFGVNNCYMGTSIRGECARIIFYCMTVNANLVLDDTATGGTTGKTMGKLSDLLKWNLDNPVNPREINRQSGGQYLQGNRNAFVDHPEYACKIWGNYNDATKAICSSQETPPEKTVESITVGSLHRSFTVGDTFVGEEITAWYNDGTHEVVSGTYTGYNMQQAGTQTVTAHYGDITVDYQIVVASSGSTTVSVTGVTLSITSLNATVGDSAQKLTATIAPSNATNKNVTWSSSNSQVASVDSSGNVSFNSAGSAVITVTTQDGNKQATCNVTVTSSGSDIQDDHIMFDFTSTAQRTVQTSSHNDWATQGFTFVNNKGDSSNGCVSNVNPIRIYSSSNCTFTAPNGYLITSIVITGTTGNNALQLKNSSKNTCSLTSDGATYTLTPSISTGQSSVYFIVGQQARIYDATVYYTEDSGGGTTPDPIVRSISLSETEKAITTSETFSLTSTIVADQGAIYTIEWTIIEGTDVISIAQKVTRGPSATGESVDVTPLKPGNAKIQVSAGDESSICEVTVSATLVETIVISGPSTLEVGQSDILSATVSPSGATNTNVTWSSSNNSIISVNPSGEITAYGIAGQSAIITATAADGSGAKGTKEITLTSAAATVRDFTLDIDSSGKVPFGKYRSVLDLKAKLEYSDGSVVVTNENVSFNIVGTSNTSLLLLGSITIKVTYNSTSKNVPIKITNEGSGEYVGWNAQKASIKAVGDEEVTYNATPQEQAEAWSEYFIKQTGGRDYSGPCKAANEEGRLSGLKIVWTNLSEEYANMVGASKNEFCNNTTSAVISEARGHYSYIAKTYTALNQFVMDAKNNLLTINSSSSFFMESFEKSSIVMTSIFVVGLIVVGLYFVYRKQRQI